jgi:hypothetical protein
MNKLIDKQFKNIQVFVYCGTKCGSMTLYKTLNQYYKSFHVHNQTDFLHFYKQTKYTIFDIIDYNSQTNNQIYIIDVYRNPIERKISSFFQSIDKSCHNHKRYLLKDLIKYFNYNIFYNIEEFQSIDEIMTYYGLELFNKFNFDKKYNIISKDNIHFIKLRFNDINMWDKILSEIFKRNITILSDNISENKEYKDLYQKFKNYYYIPSNYFNNILPNDKNFKIYNTEEEQIEYYDKWRQRLLPGM